MTTTMIRDLLRKKGHQVHTIAPDDTVYEALVRMAHHNCGALLVMDSAGKLVGILSERDYARKVVLLGKTSRETTVAEIMTDRVVCLRPDQTLEDCMALMSDKRIRHLPVLDNDQVVGVVSIGDVVKAIISDQAFVIAQLESYITGAR